jgi:hypothetical protein
VRTPVPLAVTAALAALAACAEAGGDVRGGELSEAGVAALKPPPAVLVLIENVGGGSRWSDLYRDIFGPTGRPGSCSYGTGCHGPPDAPAHQAEPFAAIECLDLHGCRQSMIAQKLLKPTDTANPGGSQLIGVLRVKAATPTGISGIMPKAPPATFPPESIDRIKAWIANGFPDD